MCVGGIAVCARACDNFLCDRVACDKVLCDGFVCDSDGVGEEE